MMKKYLAVAAASLIGLAGVATAANTAANTVAHNHAHEMHQAHDGHRMHHQMHKKGELPRDLKDLNLSNKQKAEIKKILETNRAQQPKDALPQQARQAEFAQKMQQQRNAEQAIIGSKKFDEAAARRLIAERQAEHEQHAAERKQRMADMQLNRLKERHEIFQVLTAKQQKQWLENQNQRMEKRMQRHSRQQPHDAAAAK